MKLIEATACMPKFLGREPRDESEIVLKKIFFISQNVVCLFEVHDLPMVKCQIELAGGAGFRLADNIDEISTKINEQLLLDLK